MSWFDHSNVCGEAKTDLSKADLSFHFGDLELEREKVPPTSPFEAECLCVKIKMTETSRWIYPAWAAWNELNTLSLRYKAFKTENIAIDYTIGNNATRFEKSQILLVHSPGSGCLSP